jgi:hypothetical protein
MARTASRRGQRPLRQAGGCSQSPHGHHRGRALNHHQLGFTGAGVGIALIDSGVTSWHDDLTGPGGNQAGGYGNQRVPTFVDLVNGGALPYDDNGQRERRRGFVN